MVESKKLWWQEMNNVCTHCTYLRGMGKWAWHFFRLLERQEIKPVYRVAICSLLVFRLARRNKQQCSRHFHYSTTIVGNNIEITLNLGLFAKHFLHASSLDSLESCICRCIRVWVEPKISARQLYFQKHLAWHQTMIQNFSRRASG